ncbi:hypothetical protein ABPG75_008807 [Micractinium tetrahymenae]
MNSAVQEGGTLGAGRMQRAAYSYRNELRDVKLRAAWVGGQPPAQADKERIEAELTTFFLLPKFCFQLPELMTDEVKAGLDRFKSLTQYRAHLNKLSRAAAGGERARASGGSKYRGVYSVDDDVWHSRIEVADTCYTLYTGPSEEEAARRYDVASIENRGRYADINFPLESYTQFSAADLDLFDTSYLVQEEGDSVDAAFAAVPEDRQEEMLLRMAASLGGFVLSEAPHSAASSSSSSSSGSSSSSSASSSSASSGNASSGSSPTDHIWRRVQSYLWRRQAFLLFHRLLPAPLVGSPQHEYGADVAARLTWMVLQHMGCASLPGTCSQQASAQLRRQLIQWQAALQQELQDYRVSTHHLPHLPPEEVPGGLRWRTLPDPADTASVKGRKAQVEHPNSQLQAPLDGWHQKHAMGVADCFSNLGKGAGSVALLSVAVRLWPELLKRLAAFLQQLEQDGEGLDDWMLAACGTLVPRQVWEKMTSPERGCFRMYEQWTKEYREAHPLQPCSCRLCRGGVEAAAARLLAQACNAVVEAWVLSVPRAPQSRLIKFGALGAPVVLHVGKDRKQLRLRLSAAQRPLRLRRAVPRSAGEMAAAAAEAAADVADDAAAAVAAAEAEREEELAAQQLRHDLQADRLLAAGTPAAAAAERRGETVGAAHMVTVAAEALSAFLASRGCAPGSATHRECLGPLLLRVLLSCVRCPQGMTRRQAAVSVLPALQQLAHATAEHLLGGGHSPVVPVAAALAARLAHRDARQQADSEAGSSSGGSQAGSSSSSQEGSEAEIGSELPAAQLALLERLWGQLQALVDEPGSRADAARRAVRSAAAGEAAAALTPYLASLLRWPTDEYFGTLATYWELRLQHQPPGGMERHALVLYFVTEEEEEARGEKRKAEAEAAREGKVQQQREHREGVVARAEGMYARARAGCGLD